MTPERLITPILDSLRACLCAGLADAGSDTCFCGLYPGASASADWCTCGGGGACGMAWVRLDRIFPSSSFPIPDVSTATGCTVMLAAVIEVGIYRCQPVPGPNGIVDPVDLVNAALTQAADAMVMAKALRCCGEIAKRKSLLGTYQPVSGGDCGGATWPVTVQLTWT